MLYYIGGDIVKGEERAAITELGGFRVNSAKSKRVSVEGRDFYSISYRYSGKILIKSENREFVSGANSITFVPMGIGYETEIIEDTSMAVIHFKLNRDIDSRNPQLLEINDDGIPLLFEKLIKKIGVDNRIDFSCMSIFYELLARLESLVDDKDGVYIPKKIRLAKEYMVQNFSDSLLSISSLAEYLGVSTSYLRGAFSLAYNKSPVSYLRDIRLSNAKNLLQSEYLSIAEIAEQSGFSSASYFIQVFRKWVGESPDRYRRRG